MNAARTPVSGTERQAPVWAFLPLSLLLAVRAHDHPDEILEDEDITASLPRRLGLSDVIDREIRNYEAAVKRGRKVDGGDVSNLLRLVLRRPDAEAILRDTGRRVAAEYIRRRSSGWQRVSRALPRRASLALARRASGKLLRRMAGDGAVQVTRHPGAVRVTSEVARTDATATDCVLYAAALEEVVRAYAGEQARVTQQRCATQGAPCCEWLIAES